MQYTVKRQFQLRYISATSSFRYISGILSPSKSSENLADMNYDNPLSSNFNTSPNFNPTENANSVENLASIQNTEHNLQDNDINEHKIY